MHRRRFLGSGASALAAAAVSACVPVTDTAYGVSYYEPYPDPAFAYQYYPSANVYYHAPTRLYYYPVAGRWHRSRRLPSYFRLRDGDRHEVHVRERYPYYRNDEHRRQFGGRDDGDRRFRDDDDRRGDRDDRRSRDDRGRGDRDRQAAERRETERQEAESDPRRPDAGRRRDSPGDGQRRGGEAGGGTPRPDRPDHGERRERGQQPFESPLIGNTPPGPGDPGYNPRTGGPWGGGAPYDPRMGG